MDTSDEWIRTRTGIRERRIAGEKETTSEIGLKAAMKALEMAGRQGEELDLIIVATVTGDVPLPSTACLIQSRLKAFKAACFDIQAACSGFIYSLETATSLMRNNHRFKKALVIGAEKLSAFTDWNDRNTCVLFGDGAGAVLLEKRKDFRNSLISSRLCADGTYNNLLLIPGGGSASPASHDTVDKKMHYIKMEGKEVFKLAVTAMVKACKDTLTNAHVDSNDIKWLVPHQANMRIITAVGSRLGIPDERVYVNVDKYGNTSAASIPIAIDELNRSGKIAQGDILLLTSFGAGMTWAASVIKW